MPRKAREMLWKGEPKLHAWMEQDGEGMLSSYVNGDFRSH